MSKIPKVSVIIAVYEQIKDLSKVLNTVLHQTYSDYEIIICSNNILANLENLNLIADSRLRFVFNKNPDLFQAFNQGIFKAKGKYITFLNIQDRWHQHKLQKQVSCLEHYPKAGLVYSWMMQISSQDQLMGKVLKQDYSGWIQSDILQRNHISYQSVMVRRRCFEVMGLFDSKLNSIQDWDMWIRLSHRYKFMTIPEPLVFCQHRQLCTDETWLVMETNLQKAIEKAYSKVAIEPSHLNKSHSYAYASLCLAWEVLKHHTPDPIIANNYRRQALEHSPSIGFSLNFIKMSIVIIILQCLKKDKYILLWKLIRASHKFLVAVSQKLKIFMIVLLKWMLEEEHSFSLWKDSKVKQQGKD